ncbi:MAG: putative oxygen-independent coproporphyrinogen III oxidase [Candidatus Deianiraeaceae bacterium]|jgi:putative oxygen-independent coproporphyrinogen III oxidase
MDNTTGVYIHFPYCEKKCPYCDFNSHTFSTIPHQQYLDAYKKDFDTHLAALKNPPNVVSIFFGGGTPSLMEPFVVDEITQYICTKTNIQRENIEITLEANPSSFEVQKFKDFRKSGINRISIGVQSFVEEELKKLGRLHNANQAIDAIKRGSEIFPKLSFDLIYARENQNILQWEEELLFALKEFNPSHISLYSLTIEKGTKFFSLYTQGKLSIPRNQYEFYSVTNDICSEYGLERYEVSNYSRPSSECKHNQIYWNGGQYIGIGPGAHGRINTSQGRFATMNFCSPAKYLKLMQDSCSVLQTFEELTLEQLAWEIISTGLRTPHGFDINKVKEFVDIQKIQSMVDEKLLKHNNDIVQPTQSGMSLCDGITKFIWHE